LYLIFEGVQLLPRQDQEKVKVCENPLTLAAARE